MRDMLVFVANSEGSSVAIDDLNPSAEVKSKVEARCTIDRNILAEVEEPAGRAGKRLDSTLPSKIELQTDGLNACGENLFSALLN